MNKVLMLSVLAGASQMSYSFEKKSLDGVDIVRGEILVKFKQNQKNTFYATNKSALSVREEFDTDFGEFGVVLVDDDNYLEALKEFNVNKSLEYAEPNYIYYAQGYKENDYGVKGLLVGSGDPMFSKLWGLDNTGDNEPRSSRGNSSPRGIAGADVNALKAWEITKGAKNIKIAVIDTGVDYNHPDLKDNIWINEAELNGEEGVDDDGNGYVDDIYGMNFSSSPGDPMDRNGHGTHCAGTIAASHNDIGIAGVMAHAQIVAVKFLSDQGSGATSDAIKAVDYATKVGVDIMSNSWGGGGASQALEDAIKRASEQGIIFTAAAGNSGTDNNSRPHYPSNYEVDNVISVASHTYNDELSSFSCYGSQTVHVAAPGQNVLSTTPNNSYAVYSGTSMATPHVSGVIGLYLAKYGKTDLIQLREELMQSSVYKRSYDRKLISSGRVDAYNFLTKTIAERPVKPNPNAWLNQNFYFESEHPYPNSASISENVHIPGAKFIRVIVKKYDLENRYDFLHVKDKNGVTVDSITGEGENYISAYVDGDTLNLHFKSDASVNKWGFLIEEVQYILE